MASIAPRNPHDTAELWWSTVTSDGSTTTFIPTGPEPTSDTSNTPSLTSDTQSSALPSSNASSDTATSTLGGGAGITTFTTSVAVTTVSDSSTTFTSYIDTIVTTTLASSTRSASGTALSSTASPTVGISSANVNPVCVGGGLDAASDGLIASLVVPSVIGLLIWLIFAILRPRFRQVYGLREWFVHHDLRPKPLSDSLWAFLFPHAPLVPDMPSDVSDAGRSMRTDAALFPADEQIAQRAIWISFLICMGWTILGLAGALPLYLVSTPCNADLPSSSTFGGGYNTLQDLSLSRLMRLLESGDIDTSNLATIQKRADATDSQNFRARIIILTVLALVLALFPALWKIIKEFNRVVAYRKRWIQIRCGGRDMAWLSATDAPGFVGWGEKRVKDFLVTAGLSSSLNRSGRRHGSGSRSASTPRRARSDEDQPLNDDAVEIDVESLFSISDTELIALLIDERDQILENLEIAETRYISSFRLTTPDPSLADWEPPSSQDPNKPHISRPLPLRNSRRRRRSNPALAASSLAPTSFVAPSQYYKLRGVHGLSGGRFAESAENQQSFSDSFNSRIIGSRFQEVNRRSTSMDPYRLGSYLRVDNTGELGLSSSRDQLSPIPDPRKYGPNHNPEADELEAVDEEDWVDVKDEAGEYETDFNTNPAAGPSSFRRRPKADRTPMSTARRETFPFRGKGTESEKDSVPPPHLRLQPAQPFVRPQDGINYEYLGDVYADITLWRTRLKAINAEIADAQRISYNDIADGARIKGWLMVGRGLYHLPGVQLIEGRAKEDIRWDVLQHERTFLDTGVMWASIAIIVFFVGCGLTAASGLALSNAPDFAHYLPFLQPIRDAGDLASGIATVFVPAVAASVFICLGLTIVRWIANVRGSISISGGQLLVFKLVFFILAATSVICILAIGALLFAIRAFSTGTNEASSVAKGSIYMMVLALSIIMQVAIIIPGLLLLQPRRLWRVLRAEKQAITPRQRFRALYPRSYDPSFATGACVLAIVFASTFSLIFPLIGPAVVLLLFLTLIAHRFLVGYVYGRTHSQTGGLLQIWLLRRFGTLVAFQPILLGLIFLANEIWIEGGVLAGTGVGVIIFVEIYTSWKTRQPGRSSLSAITRDSLTTFTNTTKRRVPVDEDDESHASSGRAGRTRGSMASVLEMMSLTLAVMPSSSHNRGPVPLQTETLDDLTATERAARTHPDAPPHLPPLPFTDHAEDMAGILYAPELVAPPPIIWLPHDSAGVARSEAVDLQKYHDLQVTLDVTATDDVMLQRTPPTQGHR